MSRLERFLENYRKRHGSDV